MAIKDRITKKTTKTSATGTKKKAKLHSGIEVLDFFEINKEISGLYIYDNGRICLEKNGAVSLADEVFEISISDLIRVLLDKYKNDCISVGDSYIIKTENETTINILSKPYLKSGSFISFKKKVAYDFSPEYLLKHQTISKEISEYLKQKLLNGENIFILGTSDTNKLPILSLLSGLSGENTAILQGTDEILTNAQNTLIFSKTSLSTKELISKAFSLSHNLIVSVCKDLDDFITVLEYINSGYKHFISAINVGSKDDFLNSIKNNIMLNYPQMSEEKISGLIASTIKNIVFLEKMKDMETRISHVSELETINGEIKIKDIFEFDFGKFTFVEPSIKEKQEKEEKPEKEKVEPKKVKRTAIRKKRTKKEEIKKETKPIKTKKVKQTQEIKEIKEVKPRKEVQEETKAVIIEQPIPPIDEPVSQPKHEQTEELTVSQNLPEPTPEPTKEITVQQNLPEPVREPMEQLTQKVNKYKLLKEKIKQKRLNK